jgi:hypothetical protein
MLLLSHASQRERAAVAAFQQLPATVQRDVNKATRDVVVPMAVQAAQREADTATMRTITSRARYTTLRGVPGVAFGGPQPVTSTGVPGRLLVRGLEFGSPGNRVRTIRTHSPKGTPYVVRRRVSRQFMPDHTEHPTAIYPAMESIADDVVDVWVGVLESAVVAAFDAGAWS